MPCSWAPMMISPRDAKRKTETMPVVIVAGALGLLLGLLLGGKRALKGGLAGSGASVLAGSRLLGNCLAFLLSTLGPAWLGLRAPGRRRGRR